jgi:hypothetical protein
MILPFLSYLFEANLARILDLLFVLQPLEL